MFLSKANLMIQSISKKDKDISILDNLFIGKEGYTIAACQTACIALSPVVEVGKTFVKKDHDFETLTIKNDSIKELNWELKKDVKYKGRLEYCNIKKENSKVISSYMVDGCIEKKRLRLRESKNDYIDFRNIFAKELNSSVVASVLIDRERLQLLLDTVNRICKIGGENEPIKIDINENGSFIVRSVIKRYNQYLTGIVIFRKHIDDNFPFSYEWESLLTERKPCKQKRL